MPDISKRIVGPLLLTSSSVVLYTVPASTTTILRNIHVTNVTGSIITFSMGINGVASNINWLLYSSMGVPAAGAFDWSGHLVMHAGDTLTGLAGSNSSLNIFVSAVEST